jgi:4-hydroxybenzoate polyprenyltransferase/phosphoserine phosphatase
MMKMSTNRVIAVDLDGTLTYSDTLYESILVLIREKPIFIFAILFWLFLGKAYLKAKIASLAYFDVTRLPYNQALIDWLCVERASGKKIVLCTGANGQIARAVVDHVKLFDQAMASDLWSNLKGEAKRAWLDRNFGIKGYAYAGNDTSDISVWKGASEAIVVNASAKVLNEAKRVGNVTKVIPARANSVASWIKTFRIHQWLKNCLLFVPLLAAHEIGNLAAWAILFLAFIVFSFCASAIYIVNDLIDLDSDRRHPRKCFRPFATGRVSIPTGLVTAFSFVVLGLFLGSILGVAFLTWLIIYLVLTITYSLVLKRYQLLDCMALAALYTLRVIAGAAAIDIAVSFWLLTFSIFIFLSLAFVKRYAELQLQVEQGNARILGRGYTVMDAPLVQTFGVAAGYVAVLVLALYLNSETVVSLYVNPQLIWGAVPLVLLWISWIWMKAHRGEMHDDPLLFAIQDRTSQIVILLLAACFILAAVGIGG